MDAKQNVNVVVKKGIEQWFSMGYAFIQFAGNEIQKTEELALQALVKLGY